MQFGVVTLFPDWVEQVTSVGVLQRASEAGTISVTGFNPRDHATDNHRTVDDRPFGGGPGILMQLSTTQASLDAARQALPQAPVVFVTPGAAVRSTAGARVGANAAVDSAGRALRRGR